MDPEVEMMRADLLLLPEEQLLTLAADAGVRTLGRSARDIVEALLNLDFDADAAGEVQQSACATGVLLGTAASDAALCQHCLLAGRLQLRQGHSRHTVHTGGW